VKVDIVQKKDAHVKWPEEQGQSFLDSKAQDLKMNRLIGQLSVGTGIMQSSPKTHPILGERKRGEVDRKKYRRWCAAADVKRRQDIGKGNTLRMMDLLKTWVI